MIVEVILMPPKSITEFWKVKSDTNRAAKLRLSQHMNFQDERESSILKQGLWSSHPNERT